MADHNELGKEGEALACEHLVQLGYTIMATNWRSGHTEIDVVAESDEVLLFVEVKTRSSDAFGYPETSVHKAKQKYLEKTVRNYLDLHPTEKEIRYDVIAITKTPERPPSIHHIEDAFWPGR